MQLSLVSAPAAYVTATEAREHLRIPTLQSESDSYIESLIAAAVGAIEGRYGYLRRFVGAQTWDYKLPSFPVCRRIVIPFPPLQSVTHVKYYDASNVEQTLDAANYHVIAGAEPGFIELTSSGSWGSTYVRPDAVTIRFVAGYSSIPSPIKHAVLLTVAQLYINRGDDMGGGDAHLPTVAKHLLLPYRVWELPL